MLEWDHKPQTTSTGYDASYHTYPVSITNAVGHPATLIDYDYALGLPLWERDANNQYTYARYDTFGRIIEVTRPGDTPITAPTLQMTYHDTTPYWTEISQRIDGVNFYRLRKFYDGLGRLIQTQVAGAVLASGTKDIVTDMAYNGEGQLTLQTVPYEITPGSGFHTQELGRDHTETEYDQLGRVRIQVATDGAVTEILRSMVTAAGLGWLEQVVSKDALMQTTTSLVDAWGRTLQVTAANSSQQVQYAYNSKDELIQVVESGISPSLNLTYDLAGRKTQMTDPDMGTWGYRYDALGNLVRQTDARGQRICLYYDKLDRLTWKHYRTDDACPSSPTGTVHYTYDQGTNQYGYRTRMDDPSGFTTWTYDARGRMSSEEKHVGGVDWFKTSWSYNSADLQSSMTYPANAFGEQGETVNYYYYPQGSLKSLCAWSVSSCSFQYSPAIQYDAAGRVTLRKLGGYDTLPTLITTYSYYDWETPGGQGRLQWMKSGLNASPTSLQNLEYAYDWVGNVSWIKDWKAGSPQQQSFTYDSLNRLVTAQATGGGGGTYAQETYLYATTSGLLASKAGVAYTYGTAAHPHGVTQAGTTTYGYDLNGNQTVKDPTGSAIYNRTYDAENPLVGNSGTGLSAS